MTTDIAHLSDDQLDREVKRLALVERQTVAELLRLLIEVERRGLHLALGHSSLFVYCTRALRLSEQAAYSRITAARAAKRFPRLLDFLAEGSLTLSGVGLLAPHLTPDTADALLEASRSKSTREIERMLAGAFPQPDLATDIRTLLAHSRRSGPSATSVSASATLLPAGRAGAVAPAFAEAMHAAEHHPHQVRRAAALAIAPIAPSRYLLRVTLSEDTEHKLQRARTLMRHSIPDGNVEAILNRALTLLLDRVARSKAGWAGNPRVRAEGSREPTGRHIPAAIRREVWDRDGGRCAFVGRDGACRECAFLEFHHVIPFAVGGPTTAANLQLRCRAHNAYEATVLFNTRTSH